MILIGGQRCLTAPASFTPSIEPGMLMSVMTMRMSSSLFQDGDGLIGIRGRHDLESGLLENFAQMFGDQELVFDGEDDRHTQTSILGATAVKTLWFPIMHWYFEEIRRYAVPVP